MQKGYIYLINEYGSEPERFKIGITKGDINKRVKQLQTGSSNELLLINSYQSPHYLKIEKLLHRKYNSYSTDGGTEWFQLPIDEVFNFISECNTAHDMYQSLIDSGNPFI
jgi:hypothetical protein